MRTAKQETVKSIGKLPEASDMDATTYRRYVLDKIRKGQEAMAQGKTLTSEELKREIDSW